MKEYVILARMSREDNSFKKRENRMNKRRNHGKKTHLNPLEKGTSEQISSRRFKHKKPEKHLSVASDGFVSELRGRKRSENPSSGDHPSKGHETSLRFGF